MRIALLSLCVASVASAAPPAGVEVRAPSGWTERDQGAMHAYIAPGAAADAVVMVLVTPALPVGAGGAAADLERAAAATEQGARVTGKTRPQRSSRGGIDVWLMTAQVDVAPLGLHARLYELVTDGTHEVVGILISKGDAALRDHGAEATALLADLRPAGAAPTPTAPVAREPAAGGTALHAGELAWRPTGAGTKIPAAQFVGGAPQGLWWRPKLSSIGIVETWLFWPDGTFIEELYPGGPDLEDFEAMTREPGGSKAGTWALRGGTFEKTQYGTTKRDPFLRGANEAGPLFRLGEHASAWQASRRVTVALLAGTWTSPRGNGTITFRRDGTFDGDDLLIGELGSRRALGTPIVHHTGTYTLDGYLLRLRVNGRRDDIVLPAFVCTDDLLSIESWMYLRQK